MEKTRKSEGVWKGPIWLNLLKMLTERHPEQVKLLQARRQLVKYLDERATLAEGRIYCFMEWGIGQEQAEELTYRQLLDMNEN
jgi:hypothetical protein